jgi:hypothetical protein
MRVVTSIANALAAPIVGSICLRLFQIRTDSVWACPPAKNMEISNSSNEARKRENGGGQHPLQRDRQHHSTEYPDVNHHEEFFGASDASIGYMPSRDRSVGVLERRCALRPLCLTTLSIAAKPH